MKFVKLLVTILVFVPMLTNAQKIKYKEFFPILNSKLYTPENEAKLKKFLSQQKKPHANGNLQLGLILEDRFNKMDILSDTIKIDALGDSAVNQIKKSIELITEKEIKKNNEYYQSFYRRDLRTGEFGIKLSDVHLDLEKKIEAIQDREAAIRRLNTLLHRIKGRNNLSASIYKQMTEKGETMREMLFSLSAEDMLLIDRMIDNAKGIYVLADDLKESSMELGASYYQAFNTFKIIETYGVDGLEQSDVFVGELDLWDYETWANELKAEYSGIQTYRQGLNTNELTLKDAFEKVDQGINPGEVTMEDLSTSAQKYDPDGSAISLLNFRTSQLEVSRLGNPAINTVLTDSLNVFAQLDAAKVIMEELGDMTTVYSDFASPEKIELAANRYPGILDEYYGGSSGYDSFVQELGSWLNNQKIIWASKTDELMLKDRFAVSENQSIPLFVSDDPQKYKTLVVAGDELKTVAGIDTESNKGYIVWSGPNRLIDGKTDVEIGEMTVTNVLAKEVPGSAFSFYYFDQSLPENNLLLVATSTIGEVKWTNLVTAPGEPVSFRYDETLDQLTVFYYPEDQLPGDGVTAYLVIDRTGTVR